MAESRQIFALARWKREIRPFVAQRAAYRCECCGKYCPLSNRGGQADHKIPRRDCSAQGINPFDVSNIQWLCPRCHSQKTAKEARWLGHIKSERPSRWDTRTKVTGRNSFLEAAGVLPVPGQVGDGPMT